jgi:hypothetical protein
VAVDLEDHAAEAELAAASRDAELAAAGRDYAALLRHLSRTLVLLEPHVFLVVGLEGAYGSLLRYCVRAIATWLLRLLPRRSRPVVAGPTDTELLDLRCEQLALAFAAIGARPRPGWLQSVTEQALPFDLAVFVRPIQAAVAQRFLDRQVTVHGSAQRFGAGRGRINDTTQDTALEDAPNLRMPIQRGQEQLFRVGIYSRVRATSTSALGRLVRHAREALAVSGTKAAATRKPGSSVIVSLLTSTEVAHR